MARDLVLGNGSMLIGLDHRARIKDMYFDYVGLEDHMTPDSVCKIGIWVDHEMRWFSDPSWTIEIKYVEESMVGDVIAWNKELNIEVQIRDYVYNEKNIYIRSFRVKNLENRERFIKVYLNHQFRMYGREKRDTVYWDPEDKTVVHYKGRRVALIGGLKNAEGFDDFSVGLSNIEGKVGTWPDAEDGNLANNPIEHGTVDSTVSMENNTDAEGEFEFSYWVTLGKSLAEVKDLHRYVLTRKPSELTESTRDYWHAWVNKTDFTFHGLDKRIKDLFKKSLIIIRTHVDDTGGITASGDSGMLQYGRDNYSYIWHRDASFVAMAMNKAGYHEVARKFYEFSNETISDKGYFYHKYRSDKSMGSSWHGWLSPDGKPRIPIQEDETALVIAALWHHYTYTKDIEFIEEIYNSLIKKAAMFMVEYRIDLGLPRPSFDLWEKKWGIHTFTACTVYDAFMSAARFAELLGKEDDHQIFSEAAEKIKKAIVENLYSEETGYFYKYIDINESGEIMHDKSIDASSFYGVFRFAVLEPTDEKLKKSFETLQSRLCCKTQIGGVARFEYDDYYQVGADVPGNPWVITTLWKAQYLIALATQEKDMDEVKKILNWVVDRALPSGVLSEQFNPYTGYQLSASPLIWSHAEFVTTVISYLEKLESLGVCKVCYPVEEK